MTIVAMFSTIVSAALMLLAFWGVISFFPAKADRGDTGAAWLILAIWTGFLGLGLNTAYWRVFGDLAVYYDWVSVANIRAFGNGIGDVIWKGLGAIAIYLHFYSRWKFLPVSERQNWRPLLMGFYPRHTHWAVRSTMYIHRLGRRKE